MGGFFGIVSKHDCMVEVFFGVDYHSHLGVRRGGMAAYDKDIGLQRKIHNIENSPFRTKFENIFEEMQGTSVISGTSICKSSSSAEYSVLSKFIIYFKTITSIFIMSVKSLIKPISKSIEVYSFKWREVSWCSARKTGAISNTLSYTPTSACL